MVRDFDYKRLRPLLQEFEGAWLPPGKYSEAHSAYYACPYCDMQTQDPPQRHDEDCLSDLVRALSLALKEIDTKTYTPHPVVGKTQYSEAETKEIRAGEQRGATLRFYQKAFIPLAFARDDGLEGGGCVCHICCGDHPQPNCAMVRLHDVLVDFLTPT